MASDLLGNRRRLPATPNRTDDLLAAQRMRKDFQFRFSALVLAFVTLAAVIFATINVLKENQNRRPDDGVWWLEKSVTVQGRQVKVVQAERVSVGGPGDNAGIKAGDRLISVDDQEIKTFPGLFKQFYRLGIWSKAN